MSSSGGQRPDLPAEWQVRGRWAEGGLALPHSVNPRAPGADGEQQLQAAWGTAHPRWGTSGSLLQELDSVGQGGFRPFPKPYS